MATTGYINIPPSGSPSWKDPVFTAVDLPVISNMVGDARVAEDTSTIYIWSGSAWIAAAGGGGAGTVTSVSVVTANGVSGSVANPTTTPAITLTLGAIAPSSVNGNTVTTGTGTLTLSTFTLTAAGTASVAGTNTGDVTLGAANGLSLTGQSLSLGTSSMSTTGALTSTDWNTFNGKQASLTFGNLTDVGTDGIAITGGTGVVIGSGTSIAQQQSSGSLNGYLSSTDWTTFNGKQAAGSYITALTGDGSASGPGSATFTLATVNTNTGPFGSSSAIPSFTVNGKGLITAASTNPVVAPAGTLTGTTLASNVVTSSLTTVGTIGTGLWQGTPVTEVYGGTHQSSYAAGDTLYASASNTLSKLAVGTQGQILEVSGSGAPSWVDFYNPSLVAQFFDDFMFGSPNATGNPWTGLTSGTGAVGVSSNNWTAANPGVYQMQTGTTIAGSAYIYSDARNALALVGAGVVTFEVLVNLSALSDGTNTYTAYVGLWKEGAAPASATDGIFFSYTNGTNSGDWTLNSIAASTTSTSSTGIAATATSSFQKLTFVVNAAGTSIQAFVNGASAGSPITSNIPTAMLQMQLGILKSAGTTSRNLAVDYIKVQSRLTTPR